METLERRRSLYLDGKLEELSASEWEIVKEHDAMMGDDDDGE